MKASVSNVNIYDNRNIEQKFMQNSDFIFKILITVSNLLDINILFCKGFKLRSINLI